MPTIPALVPSFSAGRFGWQSLASPPLAPRCQVREPTSTADILQLPIKPLTIGSLGGGILVTDQSTEESSAGLETRNIFLDTEVYRSNGYNLNSDIMKLLGHYVTDRVFVLHTTDVTLREVKLQIDAMESDLISRANKIIRDLERWNHRYRFNLHGLSVPDALCAPNHPNIQIAVENFGPIEKADVDLRPLTVFVGESNTGKTYLAALIYALQRAFEGIPRVPWSYYATSRFDPIYYSQPANLSTQTLLEEMQEVLKKLAATDRPFKFSDLPMWVRDRLQSGSAHTEVLENELKRCFDFESVSELARFTKSQSEAMKVSFEVREENQTLWSFNLYNSESGTNVDKFINEDIVLNSEDREIFQKALDVKDQGIPLRFLTPVSAKSYYLPAPRGGIMETHGVILSSLVEGATPGGVERSRENATLSGMIADFLKQIINYEEDRVSSDEMSSIAKVLEDEVLRGEIVVKRPAGGYPEFRYRPQKSEQTLRVSQSSSMVSELALLVLFLRGIVQLGDTLIIEEPEAHLHPAAQTKIALILARLVRVGVRVIITTHSDRLLEQIGNLIREGEVMKLEKSKMEPTTWLTEEEVGAWWFRTDKPVEEISFEHIAGIEPKEYGEVAEKLYNRSVDLRTQLKEAAGGTEVEQE